MRCRAAGAVAIVTGLLSFTPAHAYTGGPQLFEMLGWDSTAKRVYFHNIHSDESETFGAVYFFSLAGSHPERRVLVPWSRPFVDAGDSAFADQTRRVDRLQHALAPLRPAPEACIPYRTEVLDEDTVVVAGSDVPRIRVRIWTQNLGVFEVLCYTSWEGGHRVCVKDVYKIPGRDTWVYVLAFPGMPLDPAETQVPVLVRAGDGEKRLVEWVKDPNPRLGGRVR